MLNASINKAHLQASPSSHLDIDAKADLLLVTNSSDSEANLKKPLEACHLKDNDVKVMCF